MGGINEIVVVGGGGGVVLYCGFSVVGTIVVLVVLLEFLALVGHLVLSYW